MAPRSKSKYNSASASELPAAKDPSPVVSVDKLDQLRYKPPEWLPPDVYTPRKKEVLVRKKRRSSLLERFELKRMERYQQIQNQKEMERKKDCKITKSCLQEEMLTPEKLQVWITPTEKMIGFTGVQAIPKPDPLDSTYEEKIIKSRIKESAFLDYYKKVKHDQLKMEDHCMKETGKKREVLLLRKYMLLPNISPDGLEISKMTTERYETPDTFPTEVLFNFAKCNNDEKNGIRYQLSKRQQGYIVVHDWLGCPEITDEIRDELGLNDEHVLSSLRQNDNENTCGTEDPCACPPSMPRLGVRGFNYKKLQAKLRSPCMKEINIDARERETKKKIKNRRESLKTPSADVLKPGLMNSTPVLGSRVGLSLAHVNLSWSTDPERARGKLVVELGGSALMGEKAVDWVLMKNTGTTAIHYNWVKKENPSKLVTDHRQPQDIIFDSWGGTILPSESFRVPFMYKATCPGHFSEDWQLQTRPVLESGAEVILRLWGFTRDYDPGGSTRENIEELLKTGMTWSIAKHRVDKIIDHLPLPDESFYDDSLTVLLGPDLFMANNPWLYYKSSSVYRLGKLAELMNRSEERPAGCEEEGEEDETSSSLISETEFADDGSYNEEDPITDSNLMLYADSPEEEEDRISDSSISLPVDLSEAIHTMTNKLLVETALDSVIIKKQSSVVDSVVSISNPVIDTITPSTQDNNYQETGDLESKLNSENTTSKTDIKTNLEIKEHSSRKLEHKALEGSFVNKVVDDNINLPDPNVVVHSLRDEILQQKANMVFQEASFALMSDEVSNLLFKPFLPYENYRIPVCKALFIDAMEEFVDYATCLEVTCAYAECIEQMMLAGQEEGTSDNVLEEETNKAQPIEKRFDEETNKAQPIEKRFDEEIDNNIIQPPEMDAEAILESGVKPRDFLGKERYEQQYYDRLYTRMYGILSSLCDQMELLIPETTAFDPSYGREAFIKVRNIPFNVDIKAELIKPLPPRWVAIAQRLELTQSSIRRRRDEVNERDAEQRAEFARELKKLDALAAAKQAERMARE